MEAYHKLEWQQVGRVLPGSFPARNRLVGYEADRWGRQGSGSARGGGYATVRFITANTIKLVTMLIGSENADSVHIAKAAIAGASFGGGPAGANAAKTKPPEKPRAGTKKQQTNRAKALLRR